MTSRRRALVAAAVLGSAFAVVAILVVVGAGGGLDGRVGGWFADHRVEPLTAFLRRFTDLGEWYLIGPMVVVASAWLYVRGLRREAVFVAVCTAASWGLNLLLKALIQRPTPDPGRAVEDPSMYAFPSGHTMTTTTFVTVLALVLCTTVLRERGRVAMVLAAAVYGGLMGLSRVYLGVHWPGDVTGGWLLGAAFALATWGLFVAPREEEDAPSEDAAVTPARAPMDAAVTDPDHPRIRVVLFDWGDTLMVDDGQPGSMADWPRVAAVPGAAEALAALHGLCLLCVATNADDSGAEEVMAALGRVGLARFIDRVFSSRDLGARKPDPAFYAAVLETLRADAAARGEPALRPDEVVMVGDDFENDVAGAAAAGLRAVWFDPRNTAHFPAAGPPMTVVTDLRRLAELLPPAAGPDREEHRAG
jgi:membrane-associated phospholipid phosphatase